MAVYFRSLANSLSSPSLDGSDTGDTLASMVEALRANYDTIVADLEDSL